MKFSLIALGAIALCALQQQTFAKHPVNGDLVARGMNDVSLTATTVDVAARGLLGGHDDCGHCGGGGLINLVGGVLHTVEGLLESVADLLRHLRLGGDDDCELPVGHEHEGDHGSIDLGDLDLDDLVEDIGELLEQLLGGDHGLLDNTIIGLLHQILGLVEQILKSLGLDINLTGILNGEHFEHGEHCEPSTLNINLLHTVLGLIKQVLGLVERLTGSSESAGILCKLLESIGNLVKGILGDGFSHIHGVPDLDDNIKRSLIAGAKRFAASKNVI